MTITHIEIYKLSIPMRPFAIATGTMDYAQNTFIRIHTDQGLHGVGECSAFPMIVGETQETCICLARDFAKIWKGKSALDITERMDELHRYVSGNSTIKSAFDMALYDLNAKHAGLPLYRFLGGTPREISTDITVGIDSPKVMAQHAATFKDGGAIALKIKLGKHPQDDIARIRAIRQSVGFDIPLRIDANQGWSYDQATEALHGLEAYKIQFCEQPMRVHDDHLLPQLRSTTIIPLMADESVYDRHDAERICRTDAADYINIKFAKSSGITEALQIQALAAEYQVPCMIGGMLESRLAMTAKVHFSYAAANVKFYDLDTFMIGHLLDPVIGGAQVEGYRILLPETIGIGADIDPQFLEKCEQWTI